MSKEKLIEIIGRLTAIGETHEGEIAWNETEIDRLTDQRDQLAVSSGQLHEELRVSETEIDHLTSRCEQLTASNNNLHDELRTSSIEKEALRKKIRSMRRQVRVRKLPQRTRDLILRNS